MGEPGLDLGGIVTHDKSVLQEPPLDGAHRARDARVSSGKKPVVGNSSRLPSSPLGAIGLHEAAQLGVIAVRAHVVVDLLGDLAPTLDRPLQAELLGNFGAP